MSQEAGVPDETVGQVIRLAHHAGARNWVPSTSGNFSVRIDHGSCAVTASGGDKGALTAAGVIKCAIEGQKHPRESAEAPLHYMIYRALPEAGAIAHVHALPSVLASLVLAEHGRVRLSGLEMLKAFHGVTTHETHVDVPVYDNDQDMDALAGRVEQDIRRAKNPIWGFLLKGHGLYAWGRSTPEALRHLDAFDYLFALSLKMKGIPA
jgi:methylthioribulose-1-phosphate dehydratase